MYLLINEYYLFAFICVMVAVINYLIFSIVLEFIYKFNKISDELTKIKTNLNLISAESKTCSNCEKKVEETLKSCPYCGSREFTD